MRSNHVIISCDHFLVINDIKNPSMWSSTIRLPNEHTDRNQWNFQDLKNRWNKNFVKFDILNLSPKLTKMICTLNDIEYFLSWIIRFLNLIRKPLKAQSNRKTLPIKLTYQSHFDEFCLLWEFQCCYEISNNKIKMLQVFAAVWKSSISLHMLLLSFSSAFLNFPFQASEGFDDV